MLGPVGVIVRVFVLHMLVLMSGVWMRMRTRAVAVLMAVGRIAGVVGCHRYLLFNF